MASRRTWFPVITQTMDEYMRNCEKYRAGNFLFVRESRGRFSYITCSTLTREWQVRLREDIMMYSVVAALIDGGEFDKLASLATLWYGHCVMMHSAGYYAAVSRALVDDINGVDVPEIGKEEDDAMLGEVVEAERRVSELAAMEGGDG